MDTTYSFAETILKVENVSLSLGGKQILRDINVDIKDIKRPGKITGQIIGFLGPSGRGKTQLFKILAGINKPDAGKVSLFSNGVERNVRVGELGVVYQNYPLFEHRSIISNLMVAAKKKAMTPAERKEKIDFYLERFGLIEHKNKYPAQLSGGQRQRIAIIQQILCSERFILMDEPFSGLDPLMTTEMCNLIKEVAALDDMNTIIVVSHDIPSTVSISNILWMLGYDYETDGNGKKVPVPGARIKYVENLMDRGLCWKDNVTDTPEFFSFIKDVRNVFNDL